MKLLLFLLTCAAWISANGQPWEWRSPLPQGNDLHAITYGAGKFVAVGDYATFLASTTGTEWAVRSLETRHDFFDVAYGSAGFVAVGRTFHDSFGNFRSAVARSGNGIDWTIIEDVIPANYHLSSIAFGNGLYVAVPMSYGPRTSTVVYASQNGLGWFAVQTIPGLVTDVTFGNETFVLTGTAVEGPPLLWTSQNGQNWTQRQPPDVNAIQVTSFAAGRFVTAGVIYPNTVHYSVSTDGISWVSSIDTPAVYQPRSIAGSTNGTFVMLAWDYPGISIFTSSNGLNWVRQGAAPRSLLLDQVAYADGKFVAIGENGNHAVSLDGTNWSVFNFATDNNFRGVAYGAGEFIAVGNAGLMMSSPDGVQWQLDPQTPQTAENLHDVALLAGKYVAVGNDGVVLVKSPGQVWAAAATGTSDPLFAVAYGNGRYVAVGGYCSSGGGDTWCQSRVIVSTNAINWEDRTPAGSRLHGVAFAAGRFVAVGRFSLLTSTDGLAWTNNGYVPSQYLKSVTYGAGLFVAVGEFGSTILVSSNGLQWSSIPSGLLSGVELDEVFYSDSRFIAVGNVGTIITSSNGLAWTPMHSPSSRNLRSVAANGSNWVIVGNNEHILQAGGSPWTNAPSLCGSMWFSRSVGVTNALEDVVYGDGRFVAVGRNYARPFSSDGRAWTNFLVAGDNLSGVTWGSGRFVTCGLAGQVATATNSTNWMIIGVLGRPLHSVAHGDGAFVIVGTNGFIATSRTGTAFLPLAAPVTISNSLNSVTYGESRFVAVGVNGTIITAPWPGTNWAAVQNVPASENLQDVTYGNGIFVAVGGTNVILASHDGLNWTRAYATAGAVLRGVTFGEGDFVAVGNREDGSATVLVSKDGWTWNSYYPGGTNRWNDIAFGNGSFLVVGDRGSVLQNLKLPMFISQPLANRACVSDSILLSAAAESSCPSALQWYRDGIELPGAITATLSFPYVLPEHAGTYTLVASNVYGQVVSSPALLQVDACRAVDYWTNRQADATGAALYSSACAGGRIVAVGSLGRVVYSDNDGTSWNTASNATSSTLTAVAYGNGAWVAVGFSGAVVRSVDGITWSASHTGTNLGLNALAFGNGRFVAVGQFGTVLTSTDGTSWQARNSGTNRAWAGITFANGMFAAVGLGLVATSPDGEAWLLYPTGSGASHWSIAWGRGLWVVVGAGGAILTSSNLSQWTPQSPPTAQFRESITYAHGQFVSVGVNGELATSSDGSAWELRRTSTTDRLRDVLFCGDSFYVFGEDGLTMRSAYAGPPVLRVPQRGTNVPHLHVTAELGATLRIESQTSLSAGPWDQWLTFTNRYSTTQLADPVATNSPQKFYRAVVP